MKVTSNKLEITVDESLRRDAGGGGPEGSKAVERAWGTAVEGQAVSIATPKAAYAPQGPVALRVCFRNVGRQDVKAARGNPLGTDLVTVLLPDGKPAPLTLFGKRAIKPDSSKAVETLKPGEETCDEVGISRLFDLTLAGNYTVSVSRPVWKDGTVSSTLKATSNKLQITVDQSLDAR
jgi:hypothetical protein